MPAAVEIILIDQATVDIPDLPSIELVTVETHVEDFLRAIASRCLFGAGSPSKCQCACGQH